MAEPKVEGKNYAEQRESGVAAMLIGGLFWAFAFLVMFFHPAAVRLGKMTMLEIAGVMVIIGAIIFWVGMRIRAKAIE
jgi:hypothetical protein